MTHPVVSAREITKSFPDGAGERLILDGINLSVQPGTMVALRGPSGCGKTTMLKIAAGLLAPDQGSVRVAGDTLNFGSPREVARVRLRHIGLISQDYELIEDETVYSNIALPRRLERPRPSRKTIAASITRASESAVLTVNPKARVRTLSGGEKQRVAIARALVRTPRLLVADEPTAALDSDTGAAIIHALRAVAASGAGVLLATHDDRVAEACDTVLTFSGAQLL